LLYISGSCNFESSDWLCNYKQPGINDFNWSHHHINGTYVMMADAAHRTVGNKARLITPEIKLQVCRRLTVNLCWCFTDAFS